ncbi:lectin-like domain-containing protein [Curtobacterium sp. Leaf261]|uniref:lectin-like domain-containing protein n=1 Tax=Curtobacterium sp. Leaf261 TaxID=1736311 RepID=UPI0012E1E5C2|nr:DUF11 domain-containing protein [Curtobacterium sp. Leaf261]
MHTTSNRIHTTDPARPDAPPGAGPRAGRHARRGVAVVGVAVAVAAAIGVGPATGAGAGELAFPFHTDFDTPAGGTLSGDAVTDGGWLRLTSADQSQAGSWLTDDVFPSDLGLEIEFHAATHGGSGADGFLISLSDGSVAPGVGRPGASLGYNCYDDTGAYGTCDVPGMPGAFVGLGFDEFGNFAREINGSGDGRKRIPEQIVVRGSGDGLLGYRFLQRASAPGGHLDTGSRAGERTIRVTLEPGADGTLGMTVRSDEGPGTRMRTVLDDVELDGPGQAALPPTLRLGFAASTGSSTNFHEIDDLTVSIPTNLAITQDLQEQVVAGTRVTYTATATNKGRNDSDGSAVRIVVPPELEDVSWTCSASTGAACGAADGTGNEIETTADLDPGATTTYTIQGDLRADATGQIASTGTVAPPATRADTDEADNTSTVRATITAGTALGTWKAVETADGESTVAPGDSVGYVVTAVNHGPSTATHVGATDALPGQLTFLDSVDDCTAVGQLVTCRSDVALAPDGEHAFRFRATLSSDYTGDGSDVVNIAVATSPDDPDGGDPSDPVSLVVVDPAGPSPSPTPTSSPTPRPGQTAPASGSGGAVGPAGADRPTRATGSLAFTGAAGTSMLVALAVVVTASGVLLTIVRRRRRTAAVTEADTVR